MSSKENERKGIEMKKLREFASSQKMQRASTAYLAWTMPIVTLLALLHIVRQQGVIAEAAVRMAHTDASATARLIQGANGEAKLLLASLVAATTASVFAYLCSRKRNARI